MRITRIYEERLTRRFCATNLSQSPDRVQLEAASPENLKSVDPRDADPMRFTGAKKSFSPTPNFFSCYLFHMLLSFLFCYLLCDPRGHQKTLETPHTFCPVALLAPGVGFEPTRPEGPQADRRAYSRHGPAC